MVRMLVEVAVEVPEEMPALVFKVIIEIASSEI